MQNSAEKSADSHSGEDHNPYSGLRGLLLGGAHFRNSTVSSSVHSTDFTMAADPFADKQVVNDGAVLLEKDWTPAEEASAKRKWVKTFSDHRESLLTHPGSGWTSYLCLSSC